MSQRSTEARRQKTLCTLTCWVASAFFTIVAFAALVRSDAWSLLQAVFAAGVIFLALAVVFAFIFCRPLPGPVVGLGASSGPPAPKAQDAATAAAGPADSSKADSNPAVFGPEDGGQPTAATVVEDLQRIRGIGPKLALQLAERGVTGVAQIAGWSEEDVAWWDTNLEGFRGRVSRDDWVGQAARLAADDAAGGDAARQP